MTYKTQDRKIVVEINTKTIIKVFLVVAAILLLIYLRAVFLMFLVSFIVMAALRPSVDWLVKHKFPRGLSVFLVFILVFGVFGSVLYVISPPLFSQVKIFIDNFPDILKTVLVGVGEQVAPLSEALSPESIDDFFEGFKLTVPSDQESLLRSAWETVETALGFAGTLLSVIMGISLSVYLVIERDRMITTLLLLFSNQNRKRVSDVFNKVEAKVGAWLRGQLVLCLVVGLVTWLVLTLLGVKYAVALGVLAGILEIVPVVGPIVASIPLIITGFSMSAWQGVACFIAAVSIQQLENAFLVPVIMKRAVGLNPVVTLLAILVGSKLFDLMGAIVAVPFAGIMTVLVDEYLASRGIILKSGVGKGDKTKIDVPSPAKK